ncbi:MAG: phosphoribosylformylglycinamidine synthase I [Candidatus Cloacimonadales bacterium]|jgi:phosphoribosylformylglycinamidine synthase|nr:phosphoribosylformylglycinamidine synthase I [Candidatus Cloacimonadota bacterium]MDX9976678.1 phosphoribosylformylglycinamidine synthase I [Candidatus Cloacimonadales bacterium]
MSKIRFNVLTFPGSNCDHDSYWIPTIRGNNAEFIWHKDSYLKDPDVIIIPGGFSYGDYLRCGAIAKFSPIMQEVIKFANKGGLVIGICNGFQILTESGLLPGALMMNKHLQFICKHQYISVESTDTPFTNLYEKKQVIDIPIAHKEGSYYIDNEGLKSLQDNDQIVFRYCNEHGQIDLEANPNGAIDNIAGIVNQKRNVLGMMPHPERASESIVSSQDGKTLFASIEKWVKERL